MNLVVSMGISMEIFEDLKVNAWLQYQPNTQSCDSQINTEGQPQVEEGQRDYPHSWSQEHFPAYFYIYVLLPTALPALFILQLPSFPYIPFSSRRFSSL